MQRHLTIMVGLASASDTGQSELSVESILEIAVKRPSRQDKSGCGQDNIEDQDGSTAGDFAD